MHIIVYGIGSVGGFYSCLLAKALQEKKQEYRLSLIVRPRLADVLAKREAIEYRMMENNQIAVEEKFATDLFDYQESYRDLDIDSDQEKVVLLCVKSKDTVVACEDIKSKFDDKTTVVSVQNGVSNESKIESVLGKNSVLGCLTNVAAETVEPGVYLRIYNPVNLYRLQFGEIHTENGMDRVHRIGDFLDACNITVKKSEDIIKDQWTKLVWNSAFNPLSALYRAKLGEIAANPQAREEALGIMQETTNLAKAKQIDIADDTPEIHWKLTNREEWANFRTSMLQDLEAGKPLEINELLGYIIQESETLGLEVPYSKRVFEQLSTSFAGL